MILAVSCGIGLLVLLAIDQISKAVAYALEISQPTYFLGFIRINFLPGGNPGIANGWFGNTEFAMTIITALTVVMIIGIVVLFFTVFKKNTPAKICLAVIEAGAIGNLVDRLVLGAVRDFVDVAPIGFNICNFADFYITFGAVALLIIILFIGKDAVIPVGKWRKQQKEEEAAKKAQEEKTEHGA